MRRYVRLTISCPKELSDLIVAELAFVGFDGMLEVESGVVGYIPEEAFDENLLEGIKSRYAQSGRVSLELDSIKDQNWNRVWEENFQAVRVNDRCRIRAPFHDADPRYEFELVIQPNMSFGTGHHETTQLMLRMLLRIEVDGMRVLDVGCGTGVLSIMSMKLGATSVTAIDIEDRATENTVLNAELNDISGISAHQGSVTEVDLPASTYDLILANVNLNVITAEIKHYFGLNSKKGRLLVSGFLEHEIDTISEVARGMGYKLQESEKMNGWAASLYELESAGPGQT